MFTFCPFYKSGEVVDPWTKNSCSTAEGTVHWIHFWINFQDGETLNIARRQNQLFSHIFKGGSWYATQFGCQAIHLNFGAHRNTRCTLHAFNTVSFQATKAANPCSFLSLFSSAWDLYLAYIRNTRTYICENVSDGDGHSYPWSACLFLGLGVPASIALVHLHIDHCR